MCLAIPLKILSVSDDRRSGTVAMGGSTVSVGLDLVPEVQPGDFVLIHAGMAIEVMQEDEAQKTLDVYREYAHIPGMLTPDTDISHD